MLKFVDKKFIMDMNEGEGVIVIDADCQGAWELGDQEQMKNAFPRAYEMYHRQCVKGLAKVGTSMLVEDSGYKIVILFTKKHRKDSKELVITNFNLALEDMMRKVSSDIFIYSSILNRADRCFADILQALRRITGPINGSAGYNWFIYNKKEKANA